MARKSKLDHNVWYGSHGARLTYEQAKDAGYPYNRGVYKMTQLHWIRGQVARGLMSSDEAQEMLEESPVVGGPSREDQETGPAAPPEGIPVPPGAALFPDTVPLDPEHEEEEDGDGDGNGNGNGNGQAQPMSGRAVSAGDGATDKKGIPAGRLAGTLAIELPRVRIQPEVVALYNALRDQYEIRETFEEWLNMSVTMAWRAQGIHLGLVVEEG